MAGRKGLSLTYARTIVQSVGVFFLEVGSEVDAAIVDYLSEMAGRDQMQPNTTTTITTMVDNTMESDNPLPIEVY